MGVSMPDSEPKLRSQYQDAIIPTMDRAMGKEVRSMKVGVKFHL